MGVKGLKKFTEIGKKKNRFNGKEPNKTPSKAFNLGSLSRSTSGIIKTTQKVNTVLKSHMKVHSNISGC